MTEYEDIKSPAGRGDIVFLRVTFKHWLFWTALALILSLLFHLNFKLKVILKSTILKKDIIVYNDYKINEYLLICSHHDLLGGENNGRWTAYMSHVTASIHSGQKWKTNCIYVSMNGRRLRDSTWGGRSAYGWCRRDLLHTACPGRLLAAHAGATSLWQMLGPSTRGRKWSSSVPAAAPCRHGSSTSPVQEAQSFTGGRSSLHHHLHWFFYVATDELVNCLVIQYW